MINVWYKPVPVISILWLLLVEEKFRYVGTHYREKDDCKTCTFNISIELY